MHGRRIGKQAHGAGKSLVCYGTDGLHVVTGGPDTLVKVFSVVETSEEILEPVAIESNGSPVTALACYKDAIISGHENGSVMLYGYPGGGQISRLVRLVLPIKQICCSRAAGLIAVISREMKIRVLSVENQAKVFDLSAGTKSIFSVEFSPDGKLLASLDIGGELRIWNTSNGSVCYTAKVMTHKDEYLYSDDVKMAWCPHSSFILIPDGADIKRVLCGEWTLERVALETKDICPKITSACLSATGTHLFVLSSFSTINIFETISFTLIHCINESIQISSFDLNPVESSSWTLSYITMDGVLQICQYDIRDKVEILKKRTKRERKERVIEDEVFSDTSVQINPNPGRVKTFQQGATPFNGSEKRYLSFNRHGTIVLRKKDSMIDIEAHDIGVHPPIHIQDTIECEFGDIGEHGAILAGSSEHPKVQYQSFDPWAPDTNWIITLDRPVSCLSLSVRHAVVVCSDSLVLILSVSSILLGYFELEGRVVSSACSENVAVFLYSSGTDISYLTYDLNKSGIIKTGGLPWVDPSIYFNWVGFSDDGAVVIGDSSGVFRSISQASGWLWTPILDLKSIGLAYWPVWFSKDECICCVLDDTPYPTILPRPSIKTIPLSIPVPMVLDDWLKKYHGNLAGATEEDPDASMDRIILKAFHEYLKKNQQLKALDVCLLFNTRDHLDVALELSIGLGLSDLSERIKMLRDCKTK